MFQQNNFNSEPTAPRWNYFCWNNSHQVFIHYKHVYLVCLDPILKSKHSNTSKTKARSVHFSRNSVSFFWERRREKSKGIEITRKHNNIKFNVGFELKITFTVTNSYGLISTRQIQQAWQIDQFDLASFVNVTKNLNALSWFSKIYRSRQNMGKHFVKYIVDIW